MPSASPPDSPPPRKNVQRLSPYVPGEQPVAAQPIIKLNTNENPYPPADGVMQAIANVCPQQLRRYPSPTAARFRKLAAQTHGLEPSQVIATNGGDELLRMVIAAYCRSCDTDCDDADQSSTGVSPESVKTGQIACGDAPRSDDTASSSAWPGHRHGGGLGITDPTYSLYPVLAQIHGTPVTRVDLLDDFAWPTGLAGKWNEARCAVAMVVNPHAPSGRLASTQDLRQLARQFQGLLLIDQAYVDFAPHDAIELVRGAQAEPNVILLRSLSKGYSLAGLRFGYGLACNQIIQTLDKVRDSYNTDALSQAGAEAALTHRDQAQQTWRQVIEQRAAVTDHLTQLGFKVAPSQTNFVLATVPQGTEASDLYQQLKDRRILVRYFDHPRLKDKLRMTIGTPKENQSLLTAVGDILSGWP